MRQGKERVSEGVRAHCELSDHLAQRLGLGTAVRAGLQAAFEQWNGDGLPNGWSGERIPLAARIVFVARDVEVLYGLGGAECVRRRFDVGAGRPTTRPWRMPARPQRQRCWPYWSPSPWAGVLEREPGEPLRVSEGRVTGMLESFADFVDMKSPFTAGHSRAVAAIAAAAVPNADAVRCNELRWSTISGAFLSRTASGTNRAG
jgi:HD-GYP domain-containing protein (c-di-GMP phosphodiesterase class II)